MRDAWGDPWGPSSQVPPRDPNDDREDAQNNTLQLGRAEFCLWLTMVGWLISWSTGDHKQQPKSCPKSFGSLVDELVKHVDQQVLGFSL